nr:MAG TPA: hypothetical protein [Caudoviricetes sp.]
MTRIKKCATLYLEVEKLHKRIRFVLVECRQLASWVLLENIAY